MQRGAQADRKLSLSLEKTNHNSTDNKKSQKNLFMFCPPKNRQLPKDTIWIDHCANLIFYDMLSTHLQPQRDKVIIIE